MLQKSQWHIYFQIRLWCRTRLLNCRLQTVCCLHFYTISIYIKLHFVRVSVTFFVTSVHQNSVQKKFRTGKIPYRNDYLGGIHKNVVKKWKNSKLFKIAWNGEKSGQKWFLTFLGPPQNFFAGRTNFCWSKTKKSKLFKIAWNGEKICRKRFLDFLAPCPKKIVGPSKKMLPKWKNSKLFKIAWNGEKMGDNDFLTFSPPPTNYVQTYYIIPQPAAGEIMTWWSKVFTQCPPYASVLWFFI